jgi:NAD(P)-dependent dehydrogenase (short-subunit alcohol dehydrogenase family)
VQVTTRQVAKELGGLDIVASCPDLFLGKPIAKTTDAELLQVMTHNFNSQFYVARSAAGELAKNEAGGNLILLSHILGERGAKNTAAYGAAHAATQSLVRSLAQELGSSQISVNGISLGWMDWMDDRIDPDVEDAGRAVRFSIMKRAGEAEEVGPMAVWLSGSAVGYVSGQVFAIDGGLLQHL